MICEPAIAPAAPTAELRLDSTFRGRGDHPPNERKNGPFGRPAFAFIVLVLPALWVGWLVYRYGVDTPWGDEWDSTRVTRKPVDLGCCRNRQYRLLFPWICPGRGAPGPTAAVEHPLRAIQFILAYLGTPFSGTAPNAIKSLES